ncbi:helix-turn-helix domain-containing protein [Phyllobacterium leguminum]|uniref:Helix-turn-helix protein n=1 Tax=Phyllobacterium leguminum TaxID=314237 RepID=A0A318T5X2_9HYPH|nr:helix-turn-helix transcriptional regulator [Phyllobacterium leguminum]PYE89637.1 helix-turn-helix protein [Phyllobacterium leguminum]
MTSTPQIEIDEDAVDRAVGVNLRRIRNARAMSQETLGNACGITFQQIQKYEKGANRISASRLHSFARILECTIPDFFDEVDDSEIKPIGPVPSEALHLGGMIMGMPAPVKKHMTGLVRELSERFAGGLQSDQAQP